MEGQFGATFSTTFLFYQLPFKRGQQEQSSAADPLPFLLSFSLLSSFPFILLSVRLKKPHFRKFFLKKGGRHGAPADTLPPLPCNTFVSIRQHTSGYVSIRHGALADTLPPLPWNAYVSIRKHTSKYIITRQHTSTYVSISQYTSSFDTVLQLLYSLYSSPTPTSAYVSIHQHTSADVTVIQLIHSLLSPENLRHHTSSYVIIRQYTLSYVIIRRHTSR